MPEATPYRTFLVAALFAAFACLSPLPASAEEAPVDVRTTKLRGLSKTERAILAPQLEHGPVLLAQFRDGPSKQPAVTLAANIDAPASKVLELVRNPRAYPSFMPALDSVKVQSSRDNQLTYEWTWQLAFFTLRGHNLMTVYESKTAARPHRVDIRSDRGDLGTGRIVWKIYPRGENASTVVLSARFDMEKANYLTRQLSKGGRAVMRTINVAMSSVMVLGTKQKAEGNKPARQLRALHRPKLNIRRLMPLLNRGDLAFLEMNGSQLHQINVVARMTRDEKTTRTVMVDPHEFGRALMVGSRAEVVSRNEQEILFDWEIPLPLIGVSGRMKLIPSDKEVRVQGVKGGLHSGQWGFDTERLPSGEAVLIGWGKFDPAESVPLLPSIIDGNANFSHGLAAGMQIMVARSLRSRARKWKGEKHASSK